MGSVCRHLISVMFLRFDTLLFPVATFTANMLGCLIIGFLAGKVRLSGKLNLLLVTGFCGGFTTFSTFSHESLFLMGQNHVYIGVSYMLTSVVAGVLLVWAGFALAGGFSAQREKL